MPKAEFRKLSTVRNFLLDVEIFEHFDGILKKFNLPAERGNELLDLTSAVIDGDLDIGKMPEMIAKAFGVDDAKAKQIAAD
ncbi:hypothetical protein IH979_02715, partial [Patescibacteria group bacterium]|nr:hypothetical protein [Patescibacteria group bacterium]